MSPRKLAPIGALALLLAAGGLTGCIRNNGLGRPGPLFGHGQGVRNQPRQQPSPDRPVNTVDQRDQSAAQIPPRTEPVPGAPTPPDQPPAPSSLPNPYPNPPR